MASELLTRGTIALDGRLEAEARYLLAAVAESRVAQVTLTLDDGGHVEVDPELAQTLLDILDRATQGPVTVSTLPEQLTSSAAADMLGVSRPTLMKLVDQQRLPVTRVGSHARFATRDILELKVERDARRSAAFDELRRADDAFEPSQT